MNVLPWRKRVLIVSCSHGHLMDKDAAAQIIKFKNEFRPHKIIHLGDMVDLSAFMGSNLSSGGGDDIDADLAEGFNFVEELEPSLLFMGNHEDRIFRLQHHKNELISYAAKDVIKRITAMAGRLNAEMIPYAGTFDPNSWRRIGNTAVGHGYMFGEMCARDHTAMVGMPVVIGHCHKLLQQPGLALGAPTGYSVGCVASIPAMDYAKTRRQTAAWDTGFGWGEYTETNLKLYLEKIKAWQPPQIPVRN